MALGVWDLSHLYGSNDEFLKDFKNLEKYVKNAKKYKNKFLYKRPYNFYGLFVFKKEEK